MKTCVIVLGMHRSGTSAVTGALQKIGIVLPQELLAVNEFNSKGYFEGLKVMELNEKVLNELSSNWDDTRFQTSIPKELIEQHLPEAKQFIEQEFAYSKIFALKDPRMCITFPLWERALLELKIDIKVVIPYRNPFEVARSLRQREDFSTEKSLLLWTKHQLLAEQYSRNYPRYFIGFDHFLAETPKVLDKLAKFIGITLEESAIESVQNDFLEPVLKHHNLDIDNIAENVPGFIKQLIKYVKNESFNKVPEKQWNSIFNEVSAIYQFLHTSDVQFQSQISRDLHAQRDQANHRVDELEQQLGKQKEQTEQSQAQIKELEAESAALRASRDQLNRELEDLRKDLDAVKAAKKAQKDDLQSQIESLATEKQTLLEQTQTLEQQLSEQAKANEQALAEKDEELRTVKEQLRQLKQRHVEQTEQSQAQIKALEAESTALGESRDQLNQELEDLLKDLDAVKAEKDGELRTMHEQLGQLKQRHAEQTERSQAQIKALEAEKASLVEIRDKLTQEVQKLTESIELVVSDLACIKESKCWLYTKPIRDLSKVFKK